MRPNRQYMAELYAPKGEREDIAAGIAWAHFIETMKQSFQETIAAPIGRRLGCGLYGCVFSSQTPWVVKITRDPTEGPVWAYMAELFGDPELAGDFPAFLRVQDVVRIRPDVLFNGKEQPVFGIVREEARPVVIEPGNISLESLEKCGITRDMLDAASIEEDTPPFNDIGAVVTDARIFPAAVRDAFGDLYSTLIGLRDYRRNAMVFHKWRGRLYRGDYVRYGVSRDDAEAVADEALRHMLDAAESVKHAWNDRSKPNHFGVEIGDTLLNAMKYGDLAFQDLHLFNIGWRVHEQIALDVQPPCMVILDPGAMATPYAPDIRQVDLLENVGRLLRNGGMRVR